MSILTFLWFFFLSFPVFSLTDFVHFIFFPWSFHLSVFIMTHKEGMSKTLQPPPALIHSILQFYGSVISNTQNQTAFRATVPYLSDSESNVHFLLWYTVCNSVHIGPVKASLLCNYLKCSGLIRLICKRSRHQTLFQFPTDLWPEQFYFQCTKWSAPK